MTSYNNVSSFTADNGDICASVFSSVPVECATCIKDVLDALQSVLAPAYPSTRTCSLNEDLNRHPGIDQSGISHRRFVGLTEDGVGIEVNGIVFSDYKAPGASIGPVINHTNTKQAQIIIHSVEDDKLHPYKSECVRLDVTSIISIHHSQESNLSSRLPLYENNGIMISRIGFFKLRRRCGVSMIIPPSEMRKKLDHAISQSSAAIEAAIGLLTQGHDCLYESPESHEFDPLHDIGL